MRHLSLFLFLFSAFVSFAQLDVFPSEGPFTIRLGNFIAPNYEQFNSLQSLGHLYSKPPVQGFTSLFIGQFDTKELAQNKVDILQKKGFSDALIEPVIVDSSKTMYIVQLASVPLSSTINWNKYAKVSQIGTFVQNGKIYIASSGYSTIEAANAVIPVYEKLGYKGAFVKTVNTDLFIPITAFEKSSITEEVVTETLKTTEKSIPATKQEEKAPVQVSIERPAPASAKVEPSPSIITPEIQSPARAETVKRTSVYELQKLLKSIQMYQGSLDGFYGKNTQESYQKALNEFQPISPYVFLAKVQKAQKEPKTLNDYIFYLPKDRALAEKGLANNKAPLSTAYRAYIAKKTNQPASQVNLLMNQALKDAFPKGAKAYKLKFDPSANYDYSSMDQLVEHLAAIHTITPQADIPCWWFQEEPLISNKVFVQSSDDWMTTDCQEDNEWNDFKILQAILNDLKGRKASNILRNKDWIQAFYYPGLGKTEDKSKNDLWQQTLIKKAISWGEKDMAHLNQSRAFQLAFLESWATLEDHFMIQGHSPAKARNYSLEVLKIWIGEDLF